jgi:UDP-glucose 4-epimerase
MKVVVTGASGNVGTSVLDALGADSSVSEIIAVARRRPEAQFARTEWRTADVSRDDLVDIFRGADVVIHLAWLIQPSRDEDLTREVNVHGSHRVFEAVAQAGVPALVHASSVGAYSPGPGRRPVGEDWPTNGIPSSFYSRHKAEVERLLDGFEQAHPDVRVVRLRPALIFKGEAATGIRRLFMGPLVPGRLLSPKLLTVLPFPAGLVTQAVHSLDVGEAYRLAATRPVRGAFNIAADPVLDAREIRSALGVRTLPIPPGLVRSAAQASWRLRLQPTSPGWLDMGMASPIMTTTRARDELGWTPRRSAGEALRELLDGVADGDGIRSPPLDPGTSGPLRASEFATGVGATDT